MPESKPIRYLPVDKERMGLEGRASDGDHQSIRVWLRLLSCSTEIEAEIRRRMRNQCCMSLPHFDYLAQLHRFPLGLSMRVLPRYLMVADGNVTGLTDDLEKNGLVVREHSTEDRRSCYVRLTPDGRTRFEEVATVHEEWVIGCFAALKTSERDLLNASLGKVRVHWSQFFDDKPAAGAVSAREFGAARSEGIG